MRNSIDNENENFQGSECTSTNSRLTNNIYIDLQKYQKYRSKFLYSMALSNSPQRHRL